MHPSFAVVTFKSLVVPADTFKAYFARTFLRLHLDGLRRVRGEARIYGIFACRVYASQRQRLALYRPGLMSVRCTSGVRLDSQ